MTTNWAEFAKNIAPAATAFIGVAGVWIGSRLNARTQRQAFLRERIFAEMARRREVSARFKKALWIFSRRVEKVRDMAAEAAELKAKGKDYSAMKFNIVEAQDLQLQVIEAFATLDVQVPARNCMESLTKGFNAASNLKTKEALANYAFFQQQYVILMEELNKEGEDFNAVIDATFTPLRRLLLRRALRQPPPYKVPPPPSELRRPGEGIER